VHHSPLLHHACRRNPCHANSPFYLPFVLHFGVLDLIAVDDQQIRVVPNGRLLLRITGIVFDRHLASAANDGRFSKTI
jgi:hypothetical protein